jgi:hypothetical protein
MLEMNNNNNFKTPEILSKEIEAVKNQMKILELKNITTKKCDRCNSKISERRKNERI